MNASYRHPTLSEQESIMTLLAQGKKALLVKEAMITLLKPHKLWSITPDRGKEFVKHSLVTQTLGTAFYSTLTSK